MKKEFIKLSGILCAITLIAALLLACVNKLTYDAIVASNDKAATEARNVLIPNATPEDVEGYDNVKRAVIDGETVGYWATVSVKGFGGAIEMMVGIGEDGSVKGIDILNHSETAGLGAKADTDDFKARFPGKAAELTVVKVPTDNPSEVQAITGATVTSRAVSEGIRQAYELINEVKGGAQ